MKFREENERFIFNKINEKISPEVYLKYLGKAIPLCEYTGTSLEVIYIPVDMDVNNLNPTNVEYVSKTKLITDVKMALVEIKLGSYLFEFYGYDFIIKKSLEKLEALYNNGFDTITDPIEETYALWDFLAMENIKGLLSISISKDEKLSYRLESPMFIQRIFKKASSRVKLEGSASTLEL